MWKQYKPHKSNSLNAIRDRVQRDCMKFKENPILRKKCFEDHIKNYEHRLLDKKRKSASGLMEQADDQNDFNEKNTDEVKAASAFNGGDDGDSDEDEDLVE